jgi:spore germination protein (amino acid permease)
MVLAPIIRIFPTLLADKAGGKSYISVILGGIFAISLILLFGFIIKRRPGVPLSDLITNILGKPVGIILLSIYLLWCTFIFSLYLRFYAEQITSILIPECKIEIIIIIMLIFCFYLLKNNIKSVARLMEFLFYFFVIIFAFISVITILQQSNFLNLEFMGHFDISGIFKGSMVALSSFSYLFFLFFFFHRVNNKKDYVKTGIKSIIYLVISGIIVVISTVGVLGVGASTHLAMPYFSVVKNFSFFNTVEHFEGVIFSLWIVVDFAVIYSFAYIVITILNKLFKPADKNLFTVPLLLTGFSFALSIGKTAFDVDLVANLFVVWGNIILSLPILIVLIVVGKIRKIL